MSQLPKKRAASDSGTQAHPKRTQTSASKSPEGKKLESAFEVSVEMDDEFRVYPERLRQTVEDQYQQLVEQIMIKFEAESALQPRYRFAITRKRISYPKDRAGDYENPRHRVYPAVSLANKEALKEFLTKVPPKKPKFIELRIPDMALPNPRFAQRQSVRTGEIGWGFDMYRCLSLHLTTMEDGGLRHDSIYVERKPIEGREVADVDGDCCVVENPGAPSVQ